MEFVISFAPGVLSFSNLQDPTNSPLNLESSSVMIICDVLYLSMILYMSLAKDFELISDMSSIGEKTVMGHKTIIRATYQSKETVLPGSQRSACTVFIGASMDKEYNNSDFGEALFF